MKIKAALAQIPVVDNIAQNLKELETVLDYAADEKADILLTPEGSLSGYRHNFDVKEAEDALAILTAKARERAVGLALGTCIAEKDGLCYNELRFYEKNGAYLGCHTKQLLCGTMEEHPKGEIEHFSVMPLRVFNFMGITVGGLICNDMWANPSVTPKPDPHLTHLLAVMGAKVIFHAVNGDRDSGAFSQETVKKFHEVHLLMKSVADRLTIVSVDNARPLDIGVSSKGGVVAEAEWVFSLPDIGRQYGSYVIDV